MADLLPSFSPNPKGDDIAKFFALIDIYFEVFDEVLAQSQKASKAGRHDEADRLLKTAQKLLTNVKETQEVVKRLAGFSN